MLKVNSLWEVSVWLSHKGLGLFIEDYGQREEVQVSVVPFLASLAWQRQTVQRRTTYQGHQDLTQQVGGYEQ